MRTIYLNYSQFIFRIKLNYLKINLISIVFLVGTLISFSLVARRTHFASQNKFVSPFIPTSNSQTLGVADTQDTPTNSGDQMSTPISKKPINSASKSDLIKAKGIGEKYAQSILDYKKTVGTIKSIDELDSISGIGPKTIIELKKLFY